MSGVFLNASSVADVDRDFLKRKQIQRNNIEFVFPDGFTQLRLIEECRALNALDVEVPENFDLMYDITMQMLTGKSVIVNFVEKDLSRVEIGKFHVTDRYMNLRGAELIDEHPILVNWLVEFIAGYLGKKYPRSSKEVQAKMSERRELMKSLPQKETVRMSSTGR